MPGLPEKAGAGRQTIAKGDCQSCDFQSPLLRQSHNGMKGAFQWSVASKCLIAI